MSAHTLRPYQSAAIEAARVARRAGHRLTSPRVRLTVRRMRGLPKGSTVADRFWKYVDKDGAFHADIGRCWEWIGTKRPDGYGVIGLGTREMGLMRAHRVSWILAEGPIPAGRFLCHHCDNPMCVRPSHMFLGTPRDNHADMRFKGRHVNPPRCEGTKNVNAKLTPDKVREIRRLKASGMTAKQLASRFGVYFGTIGKVCRLEMWRHVT